MVLSKRTYFNAFFKRKLYLAFFKRILYFFCSVLSNSIQNNKNLNKFQQDLGPQCNHFILADGPTFNTVKDFFCMIWSQQTSYVVSLSTPDEGTILWLPKQLNTAQNFGDYSVTVLTEQHRLYIIERSIQITSSESNSTRTITVLQPKQWPTKK